MNGQVDRGGLFREVKMNGQVAIVLQRWSL